MNYTCRNCGGDLEPVGKGMGKCTYCKSLNSMPTIVSEKIERAERLRREMKNFDSAAVLYSQIINEAPDEADAYWGLVLCRYGIEYVKDKDGDSKATCHRTIESRIQDDSDFKLACEKASPDQRAYFMEQAEYIDNVQRKILEIAHKEKPYDIFISYKAKDEDNNPTMDSKYAQKIYFKLSNEGYRVFFAEETLKNVVGSEYEPIIYAALKSSKVMILVGSKPEYFEATWVKNEWQRYLDMIAHGDDKILIPVYYNMDPYLLPQQLANLQALNWQDSEAMITLLKIVEDQFNQKTSIRKESDIEKAIDKRDFTNAKVQYENALRLYESGNREESMAILNELVKVRPNYAEAYWLRMLIRLDQTFNTIALQQLDFSKDPDYLQAVQNASDTLKGEYVHIKDTCLRNIEVQDTYNEEAEKLRKEYTSFDLSIHGMQQVIGIRERMEQLKKKKVHEERWYGSNYIFWVLGVFLLCIKLPVSLLLYSGVEKVSECGSDNVLVLLIALLLSFVLYALVYVSPAILSYFGYGRLLIDHNGVAFVLGIISGICSWAALIGKVAAKIPGPKLGADTTKPISLVLYYGVDVLVVIVISIIDIYKIRTEAKMKGLRKEYGGLLVQFENALKNCENVVKSKSDELSIKSREQATSEHAVLKFKNIPSEYEKWMDGVIAFYQNEQRRRGPKYEPYKEKSK